jgi:hypothetical protein
MSTTFPQSSLAESLTVSFAERPGESPATSPTVLPKGVESVVSLVDDGDSLAASPTVDPNLARDLERLHSAEQARIDRERQAAIARLQELARFD